MRPLPSAAFAIFLSALAATNAGAQLPQPSAPPVPSPSPSSTPRRGASGQSVFGTQNPPPDTGTVEHQQYSATLTADAAAAKKTFTVRGAVKFNKLPPGGYKIVCSFLEKNPDYDASKAASQPLRIAKTLEKTVRDLPAADYAFSIPFDPGPTAPVPASRSILDDPDPDDTAAAHPKPPDWVIVVQAGDHIVAVETSSQQAFDQFAKPPPAPAAAPSPKAKGR